MDDISEQWIKTKGKIDWFTIKGTIKETDWYEGNCDILDMHNNLKKSED